MVGDELNGIGQMSESSIEDDSYFADPNGPPARYTSRLTGEQGYIIRRSVHEDGTRPEYIIPVGSADGVWGMIKQVGRFRGEGWLSLWKGISGPSLSSAMLTARLSLRFIDFLHQ